MTNSDKLKALYALRDAYKQDKLPAMVAEIERQIKEFKDHLLEINRKFWE